MSKTMKSVIGVGLVLLFITQIASCGLLSSLASDQTQSQGITGNNSSQITTATSRQESNQSQKSTSTGDIQEVDTISTENNEGISTWMFIIGALIFGMIIPQPKFIKLIW